MYIQVVDTIKFYRKILQDWVASPILSIAENPQIFTVKCI